MMHQEHINIKTGLRLQDEWKHFIASSLASKVSFTGNKVSKFFHLSFDPLSENVLHFDESALYH